MAKALIICAQGMEECEGLMVLDLLRRAGIETLTVALDDEKLISGSHNISFLVDATLKEADLSDAEMLILPGGMPGTAHLCDSKELCDIIRDFASEHKWLAAICAAPSVYGRLGLLRDRQFTCFPGFEDQCGPNHTGEKVTVDGQFITARGLGAAVEFAAVIIEKLTDRQNAEITVSRIQY